MPRSSRRLLQALTASVLMHAALLLSVARLLPLRLDAAVTTITVAIAPQSSRESAPASNAGVSAEKAPPAAAGPAPPVLGKAVAPENILAERRSDARVAVPAQPVASEAGSVAATASVNAAGLAANSSTTPAAAGVSADEVRQYSLSLGLAARRFKRYPPLARERGWEGRAEVALIFRAALPLPEIVLARSSGRTVLDDQAVDMMAQASRVAVLPEALKGRDFRLLKPVEFSLDGDQ